MKPIRLHFLGTSSMMPTKQRSQPAIALEYDGELLLFDCGEGTQRQMRTLGLRPSKISKLLISHWHGDHVLGIGGILQTLKADNASHLNVYGPKGTKKFMKNLANSFLLKSKVDYDVKELNPEAIVKEKDYDIKTIELYHRDTKVVGYIFVEKDFRKISKEKLEKFNLPSSKLLSELQKGHKIKYEGKIISPDDVCEVEKGRKIAYISDTVFNKKLISELKGVDYLIIESTFHSDDKEKAKEYHHMTSEQAAKIAKEIGAQYLFLTHFSARYKTTTKLKKEAKEIFKNSECVKDFMQFEIKDSIKKL